MPRTFSLARLLLGITVLCVLCGVAVNLPSYLLEYLAPVILFSPPIIVWFVLVQFSRRPSSLTFASLGGAGVLSALSAALISDGWPTVWWQGLLFFPPITATLGALLFGGAELIADHFSSSR